MPVNLFLLASVVLLAVSSNAQDDQSTSLLPPSLTTSVPVATASLSSSSNSPIPTNEGGGQVWNWSTVYPDVYCNAPGCNVGPVPSVNSTQMQQWLKEIDLSKIPNIPVVRSDGTGYPKPAGVPETACDWTVNQCVRTTDVVYCPKVGDWGLTYDDGPTQFSPQLYDFLDQTKQKATFFLIGSNVWLYPIFAKRACESGHQIALHTWSHHGLTTLTNEEIVAEMKWTEKVIKEVCGITPLHMRPPFGDVDDRVRAVLAAMGYKVVIWDNDSGDFGSVPAGSVTSEEISGLFKGWVAGRPNDTTGHISLEHDLYQESVDGAIASLPIIQGAYSAQPVYLCINDSRPYLEDVSPLNIHQPLTAANASTNSTASANTTNATLPSNSTSTSTSTTSTASAFTTSIILSLASVILGALSML